MGGRAADPETDPLQASVQFVKGVGPDRAKLFEKLGVRTIEDLLYLVPRDYVDLREATPLNRLLAKRIVAVHARLEFAEAKATRAGVPIVQAAFSDPTGFLTVVWFNRPTVGDNLRLDQEYRITGKADRVDGRWRMTNPKIEPLAAAHAAVNTGLAAVYPLTDGLHIDSVRTAVRQALDRYAGTVPELVPADFCQRHGFPCCAAALRSLHLPASMEEQALARKRLCYDEFLVLQVALALKRAGQRRKPGIPIITTPAIDRRIRRLFPFTLTEAQNRVVQHLVTDLAAAVPMNRLLQGDVGSGKTVLAIYAMLTTIANGCQSALLAPTEVLAQQHFRTLDAALAQSRVRRLLLTGRLSGSERTAALQQLAGREIDLVVGTHALLQPDVRFAKLGLVVIDEQHKFGVRQRSEFHKLEPVPHHLVMTATPIPRSLSMTWFGDLDLSVLQGKPPGRAETLTYVLPGDQRRRAYDFLKKQARIGGRGLIVCPRIDGADDESLRSVLQIQAELEQSDFRDLGVGMVHGKLTDGDKENVLHRFRTGDLTVLISTIVVEVGIDVPEATVLIVENAERFGLAQLHQLRGRVGRGSERGICFLLAATNDPEVQQRLQLLVRTPDGFKIAELDAQLRGIGEPIGARQHGTLTLRVGDFFRDVRLLELARNDAKQIIASDPTLAQPQWRALRAEVLRRYGKAMDLALVG